VEPPEDAVRVLRHCHRLCRPDGILLDLTSVPPPAVVELDGTPLGRLDQALFLSRAATTEEAVERLIAEHLLADEASLAHDVLKHFDSGSELVADVAGRGATRVPPELVPVLEQVTRPVTERSFCLLRRLRALPG
jgi:hypothetical protein